jgi:hypothetical protein
MNNKVLTKKMKKEDIMKKFIVLISTILFLCGGIGTAGAVTITFDDLSGDPSVEVTGQYSALGITFDQTYELDEGSWNTGYAPIKHPSDGIPDNTAYSNGYNSSIFYFDNVLSSFDLLTAVNYTNDSYLYLKAYDASDTLVAEASQFIEGGDWNTMAIDVAGLSATKIILHNSGNYFLFDDVSFAFAETQSIPEPATMLLFGFGLIGLAGFRRKFRKR